MGLDTLRWLRAQNPNVDLSRVTEWSEVLAPLSGNPAWALVAGVVADASWLALDSLYEEWGYLIDLDRELFEAYAGFQKAPHDRGRFAPRPTPNTESQLAPANTRAIDAFNPACA